MNERSEQLFGVGTPLRNSALGPYTAADSAQAIRVAGGLHVSLVSYPQVDLAAPAPPDWIVPLKRDHAASADDGS